MANAEWREILSFSQKELIQSDKEKLSEYLSWMDLDDIEINLMDLKILFRLAQDILKNKNEQVNDLLGQLEKISKSSSTSKSTKSYKDANTKEIIKADKRIIKQLQADIAKLEEQKSSLQNDMKNADKGSDSSRATLSEIDAVMQLENEITLKNKHIRKLLNDIKALEDVNSKLKEKILLLKEKLTEATRLIDNLTEQIHAVNNEHIQLKEALAKSEQSKSQLTIEVDSLKTELLEKKATTENVFKDVKSKVQYWKNLARSKTDEIEKLSAENEKLKKDNTNISAVTKVTELNTTSEADVKIKELQDKLSEASKEIEQSASLINILRNDNIRLKNIIDEVPDSSSDIKNVSDDGKERTIINKLKKKIIRLTTSLQAADELIITREKELSELTAQLQLFKSDEGTIKLLSDASKNKQQLKLKDERIKNLIQEINDLNQQLDNLHLENEALRQRYNIPVDENIPIQGIQEKYYNLERSNKAMSKEIRNQEDKIIALELDNRTMKTKLSKMLNMLKKPSYPKDAVASEDNFDISKNIKSGQRPSTDIQDFGNKNLVSTLEHEMQLVIDENEGLRKGLQEISDFLKDNSTTSSGVLTLQCPSLEAVLNCMEARHMAGWFLPHMKTTLELKAALGGKDALLTALHQARMDTYDAIDKLGRESKKTLELQQKLEETENIFKPENEHKPSIENIHFGEFGNWIANNEVENIDINDDNQVKSFIAKGDFLFEEKLIKGLEYFQMKFKTLYDKMALLIMEVADNQNKWSVKEEQYKAQLVNIESQLEEKDEDSCDISPGIVTFPKNSVLERKCIYLEETYKYIRTMNENMKNENLEFRKEILTITSEYETQIQNLMLSLVSLTDNLRSSINIDVFWKQNKILNEIKLNYRKALEENLSLQKKIIEMKSCTTAGCIEIRNNFQKQLYDIDKLSSEEKNKLLNTLERSNFEDIIQSVCFEILENKNKDIHSLQKKVIELQEFQTKIIDESLASLTKQEVNWMKDQLETLTTENKIIKEQYQHTVSHLEIASLQLRDIQHRQMYNNEEVNLLRHQIIDLQASGDNKAVVTRLSNEVLVAHLQASEYQDKIEKLMLRLNKEKELRAETENMLNTRQKIFEIYTDRYQSKFTYMYNIIQIFRQQYQGSLPLICIESHLNKLEDLSRKSYAVNEQLTEIEDLRSNLMIKHAVFDQVLDVTKHKCLTNNGGCPHELQYIVLHKTHIREIEHLNKKFDEAEYSRRELIKQCNNLEEHLILLNQAFNHNSNNLAKNIKKPNSDNEINLQVEDTERSEEKSRRSKTITLSEPKILKLESNDMLNVTGDYQNNYQKDIKNATIGTQTDTKKISVTNVLIQTTPLKSKAINKIIQTENDTILYNLNLCVEDLKKENESKCIDLNKALSVVDKKTEEILVLNSEKSILESKIRDLYENINEKGTLMQELQSSIVDLKKEINLITSEQITTKTKQRNMVTEENKSLLQALKQLEFDKNTVTTEYKELLSKERDEYYKSIQELQMKILELQTKLDKRGSDSNATNTETLKDVINKYTMKITELEEKCFKLQSELDECKSELITYQSEADRWKGLASERLSKMEQLNSQLEERHCHEVDSYKAENQHWLSQFSESQKEHMELRTRLSEQKSLYLKQLADKDIQIEQLRTIVHNLKTQVLNMQTMLSVNDPSFDLSAIVEVDEASDVLSQTASDRLELKFDSTVDINEDDMLKIPESSTTIWQETIIERLRREKQFAGKQNAILRRQIKALAARERRARLDAQNLKNQIFRISTSGNKVVTAETAALQNKIATLQAQLTNARRDTQSNVSLWDKCKRAQQAAERWQSRYEEKCQEVKKIEASLHLAKAAVTRLEREKRVLLSKLSDIKAENRLTIEKQDEELTEKSHRSITDTNISLNRDDLNVPFVSPNALLQRVHAQQHRIAALEIAEKGNEHLVSEYEKRLAEITSLKGQVLKLESTLLESQIRIPLKNTDDFKAELDYWKGYCEMLKEENVQLNLKINSMETLPTTAHQHRVNDLEQTVLTLRGLVSKLQAEQKSSVIYKKPESIQRPNSGRSSTEKNRTQLEAYRSEIANLKRSMQDKDLLLEKSKEMLKIAAEREDELLRENAYLRRQMEDLTKPNKGFLSA